MHRISPLSTVVCVLSESSMSHKYNRRGLLANTSGRMNTGSGAIIHNLKHFTFRKNMNHSFDPLLKKDFSDDWSPSQVLMRLCVDDS